MTHHGVLTHEGTYSVSPKRECRITHKLGMDIPRHNGTLAGLLNIAEYLGLTHLWVPSDSGIEPIEGECYLPSEWDSPLFNYQFKTGTKNNHLVSTYTRKNLEKRRKSQPILVTFLAYSPWNWKGLSDAHLLDIIELLEEKLGVPMSAPGVMGMRYVQKVVTKYHPQRLTRPTADLSLFKFTQPLVWGRIPTEEELNRKYAYYMDRNSSYPRVGVAEKFGVGEPIHFTGGREFDAKLPGMWRIEVLDSPDIDERLPHPLHRIDGLEWLPTAIVKLLVSMGYEIAVKEALVFPKREFVFKDSIENLWKMRNEYAKGTPEREAFKNIMNSLVGSTSAGFDNWKNRPDWYVQFVSCARAVVYHNIDKIAEKDNMYPILCNNDALLYLSDEETPELAMPNMRIADNLGCYKCEHRFEMTDKARGILLDKKLSPGMKIHALRELGGE